MPPKATIRHAPSEPLDRLLSRLEGVRAGSEDRWLARCPAHSDRTPSLSIRRIADGRVLLHCFGGCGTEQVLAAVGLRLADLYPDDGRRERPKQARTGPTRGEVASVVRAAHADVLVAATVIARHLDGIAIDEAERAALWVAAGRLANALEALDGR